MFFYRLGIDMILCRDFFFFLMGMNDGQFPCYKILIKILFLMTAILYGCTIIYLTLVLLLRLGWPLF